MKSTAEVGQRSKLALIAGTFRRLLNVLAVVPVIDKNRILVSIGEPCIFSCDYCYTKTKFATFPKLKIDEIMSIIKGTEAEIIQFGYDTEMLKSPKFFAILDEMIKDKINKKISISTKSGYSATLVKKLSHYSNIFKRKGISFVVLVTIADLEGKYERADSVENRLDLAVELGAHGIPCYLNLRPLLPTIPVAEYHELIDQAKDIFNGVVTGKFYYDKYLGGKFGLSTEGIKRIRIPWALDERKWYVFGEELEEKLEAYCEKNDIDVFTSSVDAVLFEQKNLEKRMNKKKEFVVSAYIVFNKRVLLIHNPKFDMWLAPGGHIDDNETPEQAILREVKEETGLEIAFMSNMEEADDFNTISLLKPQFLQVEDLDEKHQHIDLVFYSRVETDQVVADESEISKFKWFSKNELEKAKNIKRNVKLNALRAINLIGKK